MDDFTKAYIEAALWSTNDDSGIPLDESHGVENIDPATLLDMMEDCHQFQEENADDIDNCDDFRCSAYERAGHDFWLTRNGHGCGFWDGDWPEEVGERLTEACKAYGEVYLYVGNDGKISQ